MFHLCRALRRDHAELVPGVVIDALTLIFEELAALEGSRYGLDDFSQIADLLSKPLSQFGTPASVVLALWDCALEYYDAQPEEHHEFMSRGMAHFVDLLQPPQAAEFHAHFAAAAYNVRPELCCLLYFGSYRIHGKNDTEELVSRCRG